MPKNAKTNSNYTNGVNRPKRKTIRKRLFAAFIVLILIPSASISFVSVYLLQPGFINTLEPSAAIEVIKITTVIFFLLTLFFAYKLSRRISSPIEQLGKTVEKIIDGEYTLAAEIEQEDEVGNLAWSFNRLTAQHLNLIRKHESLLSEKTEDIARHSLQLNTTAEVSRIACQSSNTEELLKNTVDLVLKGFRVYHAGVFLIDENQEYADLKAAAGEAGEELLKQSTRIKLDEDGVAGFALRTGQSKIIYDVDTDETHSKEPLLPHTRTEVIIPLKVGEKVLGALDVQSTSEAAFDNETLTAMQIMADSVALALENAKILHQREFNVTEIESAYGHYTLNSWHDYLKSSAQSSGYRWRGKGPEPAGEPDQPSQEALQGEMVVRTETRQEKKSVDEDSSQTIAIPMKIRGQTIGVTNIKLKGSETTPETIALFVEIVNRLSLTLENVRLLGEAQLRGEQLHLLQEITAAAAAHITLPELLEAVCKRILAGFRLARCGVLMLNTDRTEATLVIDEHMELPDKIMRGTKIPVSGNDVLQEYIYQPRSGIYADVQNNPTARLMQEFFTMRGTQMLLVVPLTSRGETIGMILLESDDQDRQFREDDISLADQIGLQVSTAIDVAHLFEHTERRAEKEKLIGDVTTKIRETLDIETVLKTAAREMRRALNLAEVEIRLGTGEMLRQNGDKGLQDE